MSQLTLTTRLFDDKIWWQHLMIWFDNIFQSGWNQHFLPRPWVQQLAQSAKPGAQKTGIDYDDDDDDDDDDDCDLDDGDDNKKLGMSTNIAFSGFIQTFWQPRSCMETDVWWNIWWNIDENFCAVQNVWNKHFQTLVTTLVLDGNFMEYWVDFYNMIETNICRPWSPLWFLMEIYFALLRPVVSTISRSA